MVAALLAVAPAREGGDCPPNNFRTRFSDFSKLKLESKILMIPDLPRICSLKIPGGTTARLIKYLDSKLSRKSRNVNTIKLLF